MGEACDIIYGDPFSFFFFFFFFFIQCTSLLPHAPYWMFFNLEGHTFYFLWYCKKKADWSDAVVAEHVFHTSWPFFFFFFVFLACFRTLEAFWERRFRLIILATLKWLQLLPCDEKCFWNKWKKKIGSVLSCQCKYIAFQFSIWESN